METPPRPDGVACPGRLIGLAEFVTFARDTGRELRATGHSNATPRSVVFNVQGFRVAVHGQTGEIRILDSIHATDAGVVINPMQCPDRWKAALPWHSGPHCLRKWRLMRPGMSPTGSL